MKRIDNTEQERAWKGDIFSRTRRLLQDKNIVQGEKKLHKSSIREDRIAPGQAKCIKTGDIFLKTGNVHTQ